MSIEARAFSPAGVGNVAVGFDILGHSLAGAGDRATVRRIDAPQVRIKAVRGVETRIPLEAARNTAGAALISLRDELHLAHGFEIELEGILASDVVYTFGAPYQRYGDPAIVPTATGAITKPSVVSMVHDLLSLRSLVASPVKMRPPSATKPSA